jgi:hypothetical protein
MGNLREALLPLPRTRGKEPFIVFRALSHQGVDPHRRHTINVPPTDLPLLDFQLLMV